MVQCVRWYMSAFHAGRRSSVAKKPYNPILGETFQAYYVLPDEKEPSTVRELIYDCVSARYLFTLSRLGPCETWTRDGT